MKFLLSSVLFVGLYSTAFCQTAVYETAKGSGTWVAVTISTTVSGVNTPTQLDSAARLMPERFIGEVWNDDSSNDVFCGFDNTVSTISTNVHYGRRVAARSSYVLAVPRGVDIYCRVTGSTTQTAVVVFTQLQ